LLMKVLPSDGLVDSVPDGKSSSSSSFIIHHSSFIKLIGKTYIGSTRSSCNSKQVGR
jgi:hypothetical protein